MALGLVGRKCGMTRVFTEEGVSLPVTVVVINSNRVTQIKTADNDGYTAVQVTAGLKRPSLINKPLAGHYAKAGVETGRGLWEFRLVNAVDGINVGDELKVDLFKEGQIVDVCGISKGKGFAGGVKRHNFCMQDATHGNSLSHRALGSTGQCQTPGRVFKGKKMAGQMGNVKVSVQNLEVVRIDQERNMMLIKGALPGSKGGHLLIQPAVKAKEKGDGA